MGEFLQFGFVQFLISVGFLGECQQINTYKPRQKKFSNDLQLIGGKMQVDECISNKSKESLEKKLHSRKRILKRTTSLASSCPQSDCSSSSDECTAFNAFKPTKRLSPKRDRSLHITIPSPSLKSPDKNCIESSSQATNFPRSMSSPCFKHEESQNANTKMAFSTVHNSQVTDLNSSEPQSSMFGKFKSVEVNNSVMNKECFQDLSRKKMGHVRSRSDVPRGVHFATDSGKQPLSAGCSISKDHEACFRRRSLLEEGCQSVAPKTECFFPIPQEGQSLTSFLSSEDFHTCAELDRENAHFYISEALISAIEQIKCNQMLQKAEELEEESDEEIQHLKQRIRIRRGERQQEKATQKGIVLLSDGKTDTTTSQSASSPMSSTYTDVSTCSSEDDVDELELSDTNTSNLSSLHDKGLSLSLASLYSDADIKRVGQLKTPACSPRENFKVASWDMSRESLTAEAVALSLLKKFSEKQLPKASDLEWLVSEQDAPQRLLPLPDSWPISPDDVEEQTSLQRTRLRGTFDWAPPRAQIIFIVHPDPSRKVLVSKQLYRCAGCGMRIDRGYIQRFRYCKYLGKYFCQCCHNNSLATIPGHVLQKWDFTKYYVSNFSRDLLERMDSDPLFNVMDINASLYKKSRSLDIVKTHRLHLSHLIDYVSTCKNAVRLKKDLENLPAYWVREPHLYSMQDLLLVKKNSLGEKLSKLTRSCVQHVMGCHLCQGKGFICEICRNVKSVIFPFQLNKVLQCQGCGSCFHKSCFDPRKCPKCARIELRKKRLSEEVAFSSEDDL